MTTFHLYELSNGCSFWKSFPGTDTADAYVKAEQAGFQVQYGPSCSVVLRTDASRAHYQANR